MKQFLRAAFHFTWFQLLLVSFFIVLKYVVARFHIDEVIKLPLVWTFIAAFFLLLLAYSLIGVIENKGFSYAAWEANIERCRKKALLILFIKWARVIPMLLGYALFVYMIAPESVTMLIALLGGIVVSNIVSFFINKKTPETAEAK